MKLILASGSPRRVELLKEIHTDFEVCPSQIEEFLNPDIAELGLRVADLAAQKAASVCFQQTQDCCVLGADTIVYLAPEILGKPVDEADAARMLKALSGQQHQVITGVAIYLRQGPQIKTVMQASSSTVLMREISESEIQDYIASGEPMDKAGSYAIQGGAGNFVTEIQGGYENIVGLPLDLSRKLFSEIGFSS